eukprot:6293384-Pyramimonas_sp.AAC.1
MGFGTLAPSRARLALSCTVAALIFLEMLALDHLALISLGSPDAGITSLACPHRRRQSQHAVAALPLGPLQPVSLYQLRRGGAGLEFLGGGRDLAGVKKQGRWQSGSSLHHY